VPCWAEAGVEWPAREGPTSASAPPADSLCRRHELADQVEESIVTVHPGIDTVFVHVEPFRQESPSMLIPVAEVNGLESMIHDHFGRAPYYAFVRLDKDDEVLEDFFYNEFLDEKLHVGVKIVKAISGSGIDILCTKQIGELSFSLFKERFVDIYRVTGSLTVSEIVAAYRQNQLPKLHAPTRGLEDSETGRMPESSYLEKQTPHCG
jgi:predicted Fe-Mo cluster-binding NifX family protein